VETVVPHHHETVNDTPSPAAEFLQKAELSKIDLCKLDGGAAKVTSEASRFSSERTIWRHGDRARRYMVSWLR
jgi:hypothetical protein